MLPYFITAVKVLSLPQCHERRERIEPYLKEKLNLSSFDFFDASGPDDPEVKRMFNNNKVVSYPPCFRCGKINCDNLECNNVLLPAQVANFTSFLRLWKQIADSNDITLVLEDDVVVHDWAADILTRLEANVKNGSIDISSETPRLIRLGWGFSPDHDGTSEFRISDEIKMSNPAHIITPAYAQALLDRFEMVNHTTDMFMHRLAPLPGEAITIFPPIISELSWSTGEVESLIHPRQLRSDWLIKSGHPQQATKNNEKMKNHIKHMFHRPMLIIGHPRCGTGFAASLCRQMGLDVGHEADGKHGVSSWMMATDADENPWYSHPVAKTRRALCWDVLIHMVRDLDTALPSVMRENEHAPVSLEFRRKHIFQNFGIDICNTELALEKAALSIIYWNRLIRNMKPDIVLKIGGDIAEFVESVRMHNLPIGNPENLDLSPVNRNKAYQGKRYPLPKITDEDLYDLSNKTKDLLELEAELIGCESLLQQDQSYLF